MKHSLLCILFFIGITTSLGAQSDCYKNLRKEGLTLLQKKNYRSAVDKFFAARYCPDKPVKDDLDDLIKKAQDQWVAALDQAQKKTAAALAKADSALNLATKIIDAFYFYKDSFALAYKDGKYGFINKKGEVVIDYDYNEALPFDYTGFARVKKYEDLYLIDTKGNEYRLAGEIDQLDSNIVALDLRGKELDNFPVRILENPQLKILLLSNTRLTELPTELSQLHQLQRLDLSGNQLTYLPESIGQLKQLQELYLSDNQLTSLPESLGQLHQLQTLELSGNQLKSLPESIGQLQQLQNLQLFDNSLTSLPASIGQLSNLKFLYVSNNQLVGLPESIIRLSNLQALYLDNNQLTSLPASMGQLLSLQLLSLNNNQFTSFPESISQSRNLLNLDLGDNGLTSVPESIGQLSNLQSLVLRYNHLANLPASISQLKNLQALNLYFNNELSSLPAGLSKLNSLQDLDLTGTTLNKEAIPYFRALATQKPNEAIKQAMAEHCSDLTWRLLLEKEFKLALEVGLLAWQFNVANANLYTNLPFAYLLNNQFEKAKAIYLNYKDKILYSDVTYKDFFLRNFVELEAAGITHPDVAKIRALLKE